MIVRTAPALLVASTLLACGCRPAASASADARAGIDYFNRVLAEATRRMDNDVVLSLWEDDGVSLLPGEKPVVGKDAIHAVIDDVAKRHPGAQMKSFEMDCDGIEITGDFAHEYCNEHQVVDLGPGQPPFDGRGKMLLVLHRGADGQWRLRREMWNQGVAP